MTPGRRRILLHLGCVISIALAMRLFVSGAASGLVVAQPFAKPISVDVNRARVAELMLLDGIGRARAEQIVLHRVRHGPFECPGDLLEVDGIGPTTLEELRPHLLCSKR